jgi:hypothetical protein
MTFANSSNWFMMNASLEKEDVEEADLAPELPLLPLTTVVMLG